MDQLCHVREPATKLLEYAPSESLLCCKCTHCGYDLAAEYEHGHHSGHSLLLSVIDCVEV